nr:uncharacterized protein LOC119167747 [Rhipicephalus microplus]XP_037275174.1 uncharacterized protein LOC119167747 [Rhipicephalus microplus]
MVQKYASDNQVMFSMSVKINKYLYKLILEHGESPNQSRKQEYSTPKLFAVVTFPEAQDKVAVVPLSWLTEDQAQCHWPPKRRGVRVEELVQDRVDPTAAWQKYPVWLVARCSTLEKAERRATGAQYGLAADTTEQSALLLRILRVQLGIRQQQKEVLQEV